jgi:hypothetical protein
LQKNSYNTKQLEALDNLITKGMLNAEEQCKEVNEVMTTANILRIYLSSLLNNIDCSKQIAQKRTLLEHQMVFLDGIEAAIKASRNAKKLCRKLIKDNKVKQTNTDKEQEDVSVAMFERL